MIELEKNSFPVVGLYLHLTNEGYMLKNIKFNGQIVSEPTFTDNYEARFLFEFTRRCITKSGQMEHRREVAEIVILHAPTLKDKLTLGSRLSIQGDLSFTEKFLENAWFTPVMTLTVNPDNKTHFLAHFQSQSKIGS